MEVQQFIKRNQSQVNIHELILQNKKINRKPLVIDKNCKLTLNYENDVYLKNFDNQFNNHFQNRLKKHKSQRSLNENIQTRKIILDKIENQEIKLQSIQNIQQNKASLFLVEPNIQDFNQNINSMSLKEKFIPYQLSQSKEKKQESDTLQKLFKEISNSEMPMRFDYQIEHLYNNNKNNKLKIEESNNQLSQILVNRHIMDYKKRYKSPKQDQHVLNALQFQKNLRKRIKIPKLQQSPSISELQIN